jgi:hypothetical protein
VTLGGKAEVTRPPQRTRTVAWGLPRPKAGLHQPLSHCPNEESNSDPHHWASWPGWEMLSSNKWTLGYLNAQWVLFLISWTTCSIHTSKSCRKSLRFLPSHPHRQPPALFFLNKHTKLSKSLRTHRSQVPLAHVYNPSYSGGRDQEDQGSKPAWTLGSRDPILKKIHHKKRLVGWLKV